MTERPFERHYGELRCRRYLFDPVYAKAQPDLPELTPSDRPAPLPPRAPGDGVERPQ